MNDDEAEDALLALAGPVLTWQTCTWRTEWEAWPWWSRLWRQPYPEIARFTPAYYEIYAERRWFFRRSTLR